MATSTSRAGLRKPDVADFVSVGTDLNDNFDQIDQHLGLLVCTSSTRPIGSDRFTGRTIYETDTKQRLMWDGSAWIYIGGDDQGTWSTVITGDTSGTATLGNATISANYERAGKWVDVWWRMTLGSTTSFASIVGAFLFNLPVPTTMGQGTVIGSGELTDSSSSDRFVSVVMAEDSTHASLTITRSGLAKVTNAVPWSWANNDTIRHSMRYRAV